jgi:hypothetical protein
LPSQPNRSIDDVVAVEAARLELVAAEAVAVAVAAAVAEAEAVEFAAEDDVSVVVCMGEGRPVQVKERSRV